MILRKNELINLHIIDLAFGGAGVAKIKTSPQEQEFVVFVQGAVPGDFARARISKIKKSYAEAKLEEIISPSPNRIKPKCRHCGLCGGCAIQFLDYKTQLKYKEKITKDCLEKLGGFIKPPLLPIIGCDDPWFYRNKMEYSFGCDLNNQSLALGLHPAGDYKKVFDAKECFLLSPQTAEILQTVKEWAQAKNLTASNPITNPGLLRNLVLREGKNTEETMINLVINKDSSELNKDFSEFVSAKLPQITSVYLTAVKTQRGFKTVVKEYHLGGKSYLNEKLKIALPDGQKIQLDFDILPQAFFQPNTLQAQVLYEKILEFAQPSKKDAVLDLFCGTGAIGMFLAKLCKEAVGVELNSFAIENAQKNAAKNSISNIRFVCGDVSKFLKPDFSILITDPPRAGISKKSLEQIINLKIPRWIYVSCNPTTLARDLSLICKNQYKIQKIQPVDMFPHTYHVETICLLGF